MNKFITIFSILMLLMVSSCEKYEDSNENGNLDSSYSENNNIASIDENINIENNDENDENNDLGIEAEEVIDQNDVKIIYPNGDIYEGEMKNGMMDGYGKYI